MFHVKPANIPGGQISAPAASPGPHFRTDMLETWCKVSAVFSGAKSSGTSNAAVGEGAGFPIPLP